MNLRGSLVCTAALLLAACSELPKADPAKAGPFYTPANVTRADRLPAELRRVLVLPCAAGPDIAEDTLKRIDEALFLELNRAGRFETTQVARAELRQLFGAPSFLSTTSLPAGFVARLAQRFGVEGILFTDITHFHAYPPLAVGLRSKLARVVDGQILWAADNLFSASEPAVANAARRHALTLGTDRSPGDLSHTILQHPTRFVGYAAAQTFATLPPR